MISFEEHKKILAEIIKKVELKSLALGMLGGIAIGGIITLAFSLNKIQVKIQDAQDTKIYYEKMIKEYEGK